jgi:hypothetical protein
METGYSMMIMIINTFPYCKHSPSVERNANRNAIAWSLITLHQPAVRAPPADYNDGKYLKLSHQVSNRAITAIKPKIKTGIYCDDPKIVLANAFLSVKYKLSSCMYRLRKIL